MKSYLYSIEERVAVAQVKGGFVLIVVIGYRSKSYGYLGLRNEATRSVNILLKVKLKLLFDLVYLYLTFKITTSEALILVSKALAFQGLYYRVYVRVYFSAQELQATNL